ncbi:MAG TPA: amino acid adenylation domain-containing protein, partial [Gemmatimonadota bacterium]|nr:amino acid adenylation domain-containing protein [Gemmatimonadota bacterium]
SAGPAGEREAKLAALELDEACRPFDLAAGVVWRAALARLEPRRHVLVLTFHHVAFDGWSRALVERELGALYAAFARDEPSPLDDLQLQYADFAEWERERLSGERLDRLLRFWAERLENLPLLQLPTDRPRPRGASFEGLTHQFEIPASLVERVRSFSSARQMTPFMTLMAVFHALLFRLTGQTDLPVGCPTAGRRSMPGSEDLIGCFINPVVVRGDVTGDPTFDELARRTRQSTVDALTHSEMRFEILVEKLAPERVQGVNPLFQVLFQFRSFPVRGGLEIPGVEVQGRPVDHGGASVDLAWSLEPCGEGLACRVDYRTDLFVAKTVQRMCERFLLLLEGGLDDPGARVSSLRLLSPAEERRVVVEWNETATPYPRDRSIVDLFAEIVERDADAPAIVHGDVVLRYGDLDRRASGLARGLAEAGAGRESPIGLCMDRSVGMIVGMLAALRAGGAYVPLDPRYPQERLTFMLEDAGIVAVVVEPGGEGRDFGSGVPVFSWETAGVGGISETPPEPDPDDLAYILYTSGSTGSPKGVAVEHRAVVRLVRDTDYVTIGPGDRIAHVSNPSFDATTFEIWGALLNGGTVVVFDDDVMLRPARLARALREDGIHELFLTTALFNAVADELPDAFRSVRSVLFGGELVDPARVRKVLEAGPPERLLHVYGPTECTTFATWQRVTEVPEPAVTVPIGRPIANTTAWILDPQDNPVPPGVAGELVLGGDGLARGYHRRPDLTRERFVASPFRPGERIYRTGDSARWDDDGAIVFIGRMDRQVKLRGFRIEPGEVESVLGRHPAVRQCVVAVREGRHGDRRLVAWFVRREERPTGPDLGAYLSDRLPRYMLPTAYVEVERIPLTRNGKVDVNALPDPPPPAAGVAPHSETERLLAEVWREILDVEEVGRTDDFYDLGGHSLLAVRLFSEIERRTSCRLPMSVFEGELTIAALAERMEQESPVAGTRHLVSIREGGSRPPLFFVHAGGGHVFVYSRLAARLDEKQPILGFNLGAGRDMPGSVEEMAERYLADLAVVWPNGPCLIGGYSFGGVVAWEMARRLRERGRVVPLLILIDATPELQRMLPRRVRQWRRMRRLGEKVGHALGEIARTPPARWPAQLAVGLIRARDRALDRAPRVPENQRDEIAAAMARCAWAVRHYLPATYDGRVLCFRSRATGARRSVWLSLAPDLEVVELAGDHEAFIRGENVRTVADALAARLSEIAHPSTVA